VRFYGAPSHLELAGNLGVVATLQKQFYDLLLARTETNCHIVHSNSIPLVMHHVVHHWPQ